MRSEILKASSPKAIFPSGYISSKPLLLYHLIHRKTQNFFDSKMYSRTHVVVKWLAQKLVILTEGAVVKISIRRLVTLTEAVRG